MWMMRAHFSVVSVCSNELGPKDDKLNQIKMEYDSRIGCERSRFQVPYQPRSLAKAAKKISWLSCDYPMVTTHQERVEYWSSAAVYLCSTMRTFLEVNRVPVFIYQFCRTQKTCGFWAACLNFFNQLVLSLLHGCHFQPVPVPWNRDLPTMHCRAWPLILWIHPL